MPNSQKPLISVVSSGELQKSGDSGSLFPAPAETQLMEPSITKTITEIKHSRSGRIEPRF